MPSPSRLLLTLLSVSLAAAAPEAPLRLTREPGDGIFRFASRLKAPGQKRLSLVLGGGSAKGLAHLGVMACLEQEAIDVDGITGTSAGALMGGLRAAGFGATTIRRAFQLTDFTREVFDTGYRSPGMTYSEEQARNSMTFSLNYRKRGWDVLPGEQTGRAARLALLGYLGRAGAFCEGDFNRLYAPFCVVTTNLTQGRLQAFRSGRLETAVQASLSIPGVFRPINLGTDQLVDGGLVQNLPVAEARRMLPDGVQLAVTVTRPWEPLRTTTTLELAYRSLSLSIDEMSRVNEGLADLVVRPSMRDVDDFEFHRQVDLLAQRGEAAMAAGLPALERLIYGSEGDRALEAVGWLFDGPASEELQRLAAQCLPPGRPMFRRDLYRFMRLALARGLAGDIVAHPGEVLVLQVTPTPRIQSVTLDVPLAWRPWFEAKLAEGRLGPRAPFRERILAGILEDALLEGLLRRQPMVDLRGSGFDPATGSLTVRLRDMPITRVDVDERDLRPTTVPVLERLFQDMAGRPVDTNRIKEALHRAEQDLNLQDVQLSGQPVGEGWNLRVKASDMTRAQINGALAHETTWGLHFDVDAWLRDLFTKGDEVRLRGKANQVQQSATLSMRHALPDAPSFGAFVEANIFRQDLRSSVLMVDPFKGGLVQEAVPSLRSREVGMGGFHRLGHLERGLVELQWQRRWGDALGSNQQDAMLASFEWDNLDRHTDPSEGMLVRLRLGQGRIQGGGPQAPGRFQWLYWNQEAMKRDVVGPVGMDLGLEMGLGTNLPLDRWFILGGNASFIGTPSTQYLVPSFAVVRLGLPLWLQADLLGRFRLVPRVDWGRVAAEPGMLTRGTRALGSGVVLQGSFGAFRISAGWGRIMTRVAGVSELQKDSQFNLLIGTVPFDLWQRK